MRPFILFAALAVAVSTGPQLAAATSPIEPVLTWNEQAVDTVRSERLGAFSAARVYAMVNVAMYDAVNGINVANNWFPRDEALVPPTGAPNDGSRMAAAMAAGHAVMAGLYPGLAGDYDTQLNTDLATLVDDCNAYDPYDWFDCEDLVETGRQWGESVGQQVVVLRSNDGSSPSQTLLGGTSPGQFRADWGSAQYANMAPFAVDDPAAYFSVGPPALDSTEYADALNEVKTLGNAAIPDQNKEEIFRFWRAGGGSARPPGEWIKIALTVAPQHYSTKYSISRTARLFALLGMAIGDSAVTSADSKVAYSFWRPTTAIQNADTDGNAGTVQDATWAPRNGSIGGSPEHTSGQSTFAGSGSTIMAHFYCNDDITFTFTGDNAIAGARTFNRFSDAATEAGRARIFAGIHFEFSNQAGQTAGRGVAGEILDNQLLRTSGPTHLGPCPL